MSFTYDEEAVYQDADILQDQYERESAHANWLREQGVCIHAGSLGVGDGRGPLQGGAYYPEQITLVSPQVVCTDGCGEVFPDEETWMRAHHDAVS